MATEDWGGSAACRQLYKSLTNLNEYWVWASGSCQIWHRVPSSLSPTLRERWRPHQVSNIWDFICHSGISCKRKRKSKRGLSWQWNELLNLVIMKSRRILIPFYSPRGGGAFIVLQEYNVGGKNRWPKLHETRHHLIPGMSTTINPGQIPYWYFCNRVQNCYWWTSALTFEIKKKNKNFLLDCVVKAVCANFVALHLLSNSALKVFQMKFDSEQIWLGF